MPPIKQAGIKLTGEQERVLNMIATTRSETRLWQYELVAATRLFGLGLIARNTLHAEYVKMTPAGWAYLESRGGFEKESK